MELNSVVLLLMYISFFNTFHYTKIPIRSSYASSTKPLISIEAWFCLSSPIRKEVALQHKFVSYSMESIIGKCNRDRDPDIHALSFSFDGDNPPTVFTLHKYNGNGRPRSQDLRVMGGSFPVSDSRSARHGETAAQGH